MSFAHPTLEGLGYPGFSQVLQACFKGQQILVFSTLQRSGVTFSGSLEEQFNTVNDELCLIKIFPVSESVLYARMAGVHSAEDGRRLGGRSTDWDSTGGGTGAVMVITVRTST